MEQLAAEQQADVSKMNTERLCKKLGEAGYDKEELESFDRADLLNLFADYLLKHPPPPRAEGGAVGGMSDEELALRREELELKKLAEERKKLAEERATKELEARQKELKLAEERAAKELEARQQEIELKKLAEERKKLAEERAVREMELKKIELQMREEELNRQKLKDEAEKNARNPWLVKPVFMERP